MDHIAATYTDEQLAAEIDRLHEELYGPTGTVRGGKRRDAFVIVLAALRREQASRSR